MTMAIVISTTYRHPSSPVLPKPVRSGLFPGRMTMMTMMTMIDALL